MPGEKHREVYWDLERGWCLRAQSKYVGLFWDKSIWIIETKTASCVRVPVELPGRPGYINGDPSIRGWHGVALLPAELQAVTVKIKEGSQSPLAVKYMNTFFFFRRSHYVGCSASLRMQSWLSWGQGKGLLLRLWSFLENNNDCFLWD